MSSRPHGEPGAASGSPPSKAGSDRSPWDPTPPVGDGTYDPTGLTTAPAPPVASRPFLLVLASPAAAQVGQIIPIETAVSLGRAADASVVINDPALSRRHVEITRSDATFTLRDLGSRNGTLVNGARVVAIALVPGDQVQVGATVLQLLDGTARKGESWIKRALATSGVALWEYDASTDAFRFSEHADQVLDLPLSALARRSLPLAACVYAEDIDRLRGSLASARAGGALELELRLVVSPAVERWVLLRGQAGEVEHLVAGTIVDVTSRRRREATLVRTALVFESLLDGVALTDGDGTLVDLNPAMARAFALGRQQAIGQGLFAGVPVAEPAQVLREASAAMAATGRWTATLPIGADRQFEILAFPLRTEHGETAGTTWVFRDVSERQRMAAQIAFLDRLVSLGTLSAGMAHEINNPLAFILGNAEAARDALANDPSAPVRELLDDVIQGAQRIAALVGDLKKFARGADGAELTAVDVGTAVALALKFAGVTTQEHARVVVKLESTRKVRAVESQLVQVLINLLLNAAQAMRGDRAQATITIQARDERQGVAIDVIDTGVGTTPDVLARAFEPFFTTKGVTNSGLGLAICHGLITGMGGEISLDSDGASGTRARIWLPSAPSAPKPRDRPITAELRRLRVLVVDDEPLLLRTAVRMLREHEVITAEGYRAAVEHLFTRREPYDVVVCDLMMPDGSGMELHERVVAERPELAPAMVFLTGGALSPRSEGFLAEPGRRHLLKPMTRDSLRAALQAAARDHLGDG